MFHLLRGWRDRFADGRISASGIICFECFQLVLEFKSADKMAKVWDIGDILLLDKEICVLIAVIPSSIGYNMYRVQSLDSGEFKTVHKHQLSEVLVEDFGEVLEADWDTSLECIVPEAPYTEVTEVEVKNPDRFAKMSEDELDDVAKSRLSLNTENQTRWAVRLYRG